MDRGFELIRAASDIRFAYERLSRATLKLEDHGWRELSLEAFDLELKLVKLHGQVVQLASQTPAAPRRNQPCDFQDELPF